MIGDDHFIKKGNFLAGTLIILDRNPYGMILG